MREMTARQREVLGFIRMFTERHGAPPTVREIGEHFGFTARAAFDHLRALERKGMLQRRISDRRVSRTLVLTDRPPARTGAVREIPVMGRIAAGVPRHAEQEVEERIPVAAEWLQGKGEDLFALRVRGDSMIDAHIMDGDMVLVRRQETAQPGDIVAALLDNEATVKRFSRDGRAIVLKAEHPTMQPLVVEPGRKDFRILGKVMGLFRGL
ncbi:MAG: transcriptional repressor LexA [Candidatus Rokubacteria bacterium]|nr:transcriptional repressor LexA [Candidatus Rokubacteria bacterium]